MYFRLHDFDNNTKLDGLEILQAIHHTIHKGDEDNEEKDNEGSGGHNPSAKPHEVENNLPYFIGEFLNILYITMQARPTRGYELSTTDKT